MTRGNPSELVEADPEIERTALRNLRNRLRQREEEIDREREAAMDDNEQNPRQQPPGRVLQGNPVFQPMTMSDYARPDLRGTESSIVRPAVAANNFEIKPNIIQMVQQFVQFDGLQDEDPNAHLANFLEICDTFKINGVTTDAIRLRLFPFSLRARAKQWLNSLPRVRLLPGIRWQRNFYRSTFHLQRLPSLGMTYPLIHSLSWNLSMTLGRGSKSC